MIREEYDGYKIYPFDNIHELYEHMEMYCVSDFDIIETSCGFIAESKSDGDWMIYDKDGRFHYNQ